MGLQGSHGPLSVGESYELALGSAEAHMTSGDQPTPAGPTPSLVEGHRR